LRFGVAGSPGCPQNVAQPFRAALSFGQPLIAAFHVMVAFQITVNGKPYCESEDLTVVTMVVDEVRRRNARRISLHARAGEAAVQWLAADLTVGDEIVIRVVDSADLQEAAVPTCSFCGREAHEASSVVQGPSAAICDVCVGSLSAALREGSPLPLGVAIRDEPDWICGLCGKAPGVVPGVMVRNGAAVCPECLRACVDILSENAGDSRSSDA
jgi:hypothetical protein